MKCYCNTLPEPEICQRCKDIAVKKPSNSALSAGLDCLDGVEVVAIEKYRGGFIGLNNDYNKARVTISLKFPEHLKLYYKLKGMAD